MTQVAYGIALDAIGAARNGSRVWATPSLALRAVQDPTITVDLEHGDPIGQVIYLERHRRGDVWAVAEVDNSVTAERIVAVHEQPSCSPFATRSAEPVLRAMPCDYYWSISRIGDPDIGFALAALALTATPARVGATPVVIRPGNASEAAFRSHNAFERGLLQRAHRYDLRRHGTPIVVQGERPQPAGLTLEPRQAAPVELRSAAAVDVRRARRELDLLIAPAERPTTIFARGKRFVESFAHGAFDGVDAARVKVNRDHVRERVIGKALRLDPWDEQGLVGTIRLADVHDAHEALELVDEGLLGVSAGFLVPPGGEQWKDNHRHVRRAQLDHVALVVEPAYESARVTAVRAAELATV